MFACTGILANHESPLRPKRFVTQKIIQGVRMIKAGKQYKLQLGNLDVWRDWGWAADYVKAMHLMLQANQANDYLIASGSTVSLRHFVHSAFEVAGLEAGSHLESTESLMRPSDLQHSAVNPLKIKTDLGWSTNRSIDEIVKKMYHDDFF